MNCYLYTNINDIRKYSITKLIFIIFNHKLVDSLNRNSDLLVLIYKNNRCSTLSNNYQNLNYFIFIFLILFLFNISSHLAIYNIKKKTKIAFQI